MVAVVDDVDDDDDAAAAAAAGVAEPVIIPIRPIVIIPLMTPCDERSERRERSDGGRKGKSYNKGKGERGRHIGR